MSEARETEVGIAAGRTRLGGTLGLVDHPVGVVLFAHGSGSGRHSPRNRFVAEVLRSAGLATLLMDLLTEEEERDRANVFDVELLASRLGAATDHLAGRAETEGLPSGYFGASTGAAAALVAAADRPGISAVVSRGGRPDLAGDRLSEVRAPTRLIVGGNDPAVLRMNQEALELMPGEKDLRVVPGAGHLFEEPGALEEVADLAVQWFARYTGGVAGPAEPGQKAP